tara:strand:+ start:292 stop:684 length:393 start_codon:yes stop_codon:yes gene_type:complete
LSDAGKGFEARQLQTLFGVVKMKEWFEKLDRTKQLVIKYLRTFPHTRDNDKELFFMILSDYYRAIPKEQRSDDEDRFLSDLYLLMKYAPDKGTISRVRRRIQHRDGVFLATPEVSEFRESWEKNFKEWKE